MKRFLLTALMLVVLAVPGLAQEPRLPQLDDGQVIMEWSDFQKILEELLKPPVEIKDAFPLPPVGFSIRTAVFAVEQKEGFALVRADYGIEVLEAKEWVKVGIGRDGSGVSEVLVDGGPGILMNEDGVIYLLLQGRAAHRVQVTHTVAAPRSPGPNSFVVPVAEVSGAMISLSAPEELSDLAIAGAVITSQSKKDGRWSIAAVGGALSELAVSYSVPTPEALLSPEDKAKIEPKIYSSLELLLTVADEVTSAQAVLNYDIKHAPVSKLSVVLPAGFEVVNVEGPGVAAWKADAGALNVAIGYEVQGAYTLTVQLEAKREKASGEVLIPELSTAGVERESGFVAVETSESLEVEVAKIDGLLPMDATELPDSLRGRTRYPVLYAFRFSRHPFGGTLAVTRHGEIEVLPAAVDAINLVALFNEDGKSVTRVIYEVRNNRKQYLKVDLPERAEVWSAYVDDEAVKPARNDKGQTLIPLKKSGADVGKVSFTVELIYFAPIDAMKEKKRGSIQSVFPKIDIPASEMLLTLYLPSKCEYEDFEGDLTEIEEEGPRTGLAMEAPAAPGASEIILPKSRQASKRALDRQQMMEKEIADKIQVQQAANMPANMPAPGGQFPAQTSSGRAGILPVKFNVPLRGEVRRFEKLLVMEEAPGLEFKYREMGKPFPWAKVWRAVKVFIWLLILLALVLAVRLLIVKNLRKTDSAPPLPPPIR